MGDLGYDFGTVNLVDIVKYAGASGDFNRIHYDDAWARTQGYRTNFAQGMLLMGWAGSVLARLDGGLYVQRLSCRFVDQLYCGDGMRLEATFEESDRRTLDWNVRAVGEEAREGPIAAKGSAVLAPLDGIAR